MRATKMLKGVFLWAWGRGRVTNLLTVVVALTLATFTPALAANGQPLIMGITSNSASAVTRLTANIANPTLQLWNTSTSAGATPLSLVTSSSRPPMAVNSSTKVANLNADKVDGKDSATFMANSTYRLGQGQERQGQQLGDGSKVLSQSCLPGDRLLSGGPASVNAASDVLDSFASDTNTWQARINDSAVSGGDNFTVVVLCADQ